MPNKAADILLNGSYILISKSNYQIYKSILRKNNYG